VKDGNRKVSRADVVDIECQAFNCERPRHSS
jgi:hypothetical protein